MLARKESCLPCVPRVILAEHMESSDPLITLSERTMYGSLVDEHRDMTELFRSPYSLADTTRKVTEQILH
jgi:hypothetical protein